MEYEQVFSQGVARGIQKKYLCAKCWSTLLIQAVDLTFENLIVFCQNCGNDQGLISRGYLARMLRNDQQNYYEAGRNLRHLVARPREYYFEIIKKDEGMPINTIRTKMLFPPLGSIRKGESKEEAKAAGRKFPKDLDHFRLVFNEGEEPAAEAAKMLFGENPKSLRVTLPFTATGRVWDYWLKAYAGNRCIATSDGDVMLWWIDNETGEIRSINGRDPKTGEPVPYYKNMVVGITHNDRKPIYCKPVGKLQLMFTDFIAEATRFAPMSLHTSSWNDIVHITNLLDMYEALANEARVPLAGTEMLLRREWREITAPKPGKPEEKVKVKKSLLTLDIIDERWKTGLWRKAQADAFRLAETENDEDDGLDEAAYTDQEVTEGYKPLDLDKLAPIPDDDEDPPPNLSVETTPTQDPDRPKDADDYDTFYKYTRGQLGMAASSAHGFILDNDNNAQAAYDVVKEMFLTKEQKTNMSEG